MVAGEELGPYWQLVGRKAQGFTRDFEAEGRAAAAFLRNMNRNGDEAKLNLVVQATHRLLDAPLIGPALTRGARWLVRRGRKRVR